MAIPEINFTCVSASANSLLIHVPPRQRTLMYNDDQEQRKRRFAVKYICNTTYRLCCIDYIGSTHTYIGCYTEGCTYSKS